MSDNFGGFYVERDCEKCGLLLKLSEQNKWQNRFCILKDNFLFWYKEDDGVKMKRTKYFNTKPQGIIYLSDCIIREYVDQTQSCSFVIENCVFQKPMVFMAENEANRDAWIDKLTFNSNINYHNMLETQRFVKELMDTSSTLKYTKVKRLFDNVKYENEELMKLKEQLEKENEDKQKCLLELQTEFSKVKEEVDDAYQVMNNLQKSKSQLENKNTDLEKELQRLDLEQLKTAQLMGLSTSKNSEVDELQRKLEEISQQKEKIDQDRNDVKQKLLEREDMSTILEKENHRIINQAQELNNLINKLKNDNVDIERKLEIEKAARIDAENRLRDADISLERLHCSIVEGGTKYSDEKKEEMTTDVNKLKDYFEEVIRAQAPPKSPVRRACVDTRHNTTVVNDKENCTTPANGQCDTVLLRSGCSEATTRVREQSRLIREEHRKRISVINWDE